MRTTLDKQLWGRWTATFLGFPLAGLAANAVAGRIDSGVAAAAGGLAAGLALGAVQSLALRNGLGSKLRWIGATMVGFSAGLATGATAVDFRTTTGSLVVMGALTGLGVGAAQSVTMRRADRLRVVWVPLLSALWALGWLITAQVIDTDRQWANFGASGALVVSVLSGAALAALRRSSGLPSSAPTLAVAR